MLFYYTQFAYGATASGQPPHESAAPPTRGRLYGVNVCKDVYRVRPERNHDALVPEQNLRPD